jgi:hypothetical protein
LYYFSSGSDHASHHDQGRKLQRIKDIVRRSGSYNAKEVGASGLGGGLKHNESEHGEGLVLNQNMFMMAFHEAGFDGDEAVKTFRGEM